MTEPEAVQPEHARRTVVLYSAVAAMVIAAAGASVTTVWLNPAPYHPVDLFMQAVPPTSAAALLAGLCIGFVSLSPAPRLTFLNAFTFPLMHIAITWVLALLLSSRPNALIEPLPQQVPIQAWLSPATCLIAFGAELALFMFAAVIGWRRSPSEPMQAC